MGRFAGMLALLIGSVATVAQDPRGRDLSTLAALQQAVRQAKQLTANNQADAAVTLLEKYRTEGKGLPAFSAALEQAYRAALDQRVRSGIEPKRQAELEAKLKALAPAVTPTPSPEIDPSPLPEPPIRGEEPKAPVRPLLPPVPSAPKSLPTIDAPEPPPPFKTPVRPLPESPVPADVVPPETKQTTPPALETIVPPPAPPRRESSSALAVARDRFAAREYRQALDRFRAAVQAGETFSQVDREEYGYCRLYAVAMQLKDGAAAEPAVLVQEVTEAVKLSPERLGRFGDTLVAQLGKQVGSRPTGPSTTRPPVTAAEQDWKVLQTGNFTIRYLGSATAESFVRETAETAEAARREMYERWTGPAGADWSPRCEIVIHADGSAYRSATKKEADQGGHSRVAVQSGRVTARRIDLRADDPTVLDVVLPNEVTQVMLAELFVEQPLPRWAVVGIAALSECPAGVARYRRLVPIFLQDRKLTAVGPFLQLSDFPQVDAVTPFYVQSFSLVEFLVQRRGAKTLIAFLREAPRRGYERALQSYYGFKDMADLQEQWVKHMQRSAE